PGRGVRRTPAPGRHHGPALGALADPTRRARANARHAGARAGRQQRPDVGGRTVLHRATGRRRRERARDLSALGPWHPRNGAARRLPPAQHRVVRAAFREHVDRSSGRAVTRQSLASLLSTAVVLGACEPQARADTRADGPGYPPEILTRQDLQSLVEAGLDRRVEPLAQALESADPLMRATASCALASFQPHALGGELEKRLQDDDTRARHCAAFAIGQLGLHGESSIGALFGALSAESNQAVRTALLEAIGKVGTGEDLAQLLGMAHSLRPTDDHGLALALYHFGRRRITHPDAAPHIARLAAAQDERTAHIAGLALGTSRDPVDWGLSARDVRGLLDATPWDRCSAGPLLSVLARVAAPEDAARARSWLERAKHWTVAAAAARALGPYAGSDSLSTAALIRALDDTSPHIATTAAQVLASRASGIHGAVSWEGLVRSTMDRPAVAAALLPALVGTPGESLVLTWADGRSNAPAFYAWPALARTRLPEADDLLLRALQGDRRRAYIAAAALADRLEAGNGAE